MKYVHTVVLTLILITFFCCFFGYCMMKSCRRAVDLEFQEIHYMRDVEAQAGGGGSSSGGGSGSASGGAKSKDGSKTRSKDGSKTKSKSGNGKGSKATKSAGGGSAAAKSSGGGDGAIVWDAAPAADGGVKW